MSNKKAVADFLANIKLSKTATLEKYKSDIFELKENGCTNHQVKDYLEQVYGIDIDYQTIQKFILKHKKAELSPVFKSKVDHVNETKIPVVTKKVSTKNEFITTKPSNPYEIGTFDEATFEMHKNLKRELTYAESLIYQNMLNALPKDKYKAYVEDRTPTAELSDEGKKYREIYKLAWPTLKRGWWQDEDELAGISDNPLSLINADDLISKD